MSPMQTDIRALLESGAAHTDQALQRLLPSPDQVPVSIHRAMRHSVFAGGKRLRPILCMEAARMVAKDAAYPAGVEELGSAIEMIHTYSLIHDDLPAMDDDDLRRGLPTCHKKFSEALAILAGDALLTLAFQVLAAQYPPSTAAGCCLELARGSGAAGMVGGQVEDLTSEQAEPRGTASIAALEHIHQNKTGALFRACLALGVWAAQGERPGGPDRDLLQRLETFGRCFGLIFQITDDLIDVEGNADHAGKGVGKDAARGKLTYPGLLGVAESRRRARDLSAQALAAIEPLGPPGQPLAELLRFVLARDR
jgi:geranylgeranyl diphosphate synthase, type II